jgi:hypothetical protein
MLGRRPAGTTGSPSTTTLPRGPGRRGRPRSAPPLAGRPEPGRRGQPRRTRSGGRRRGDIGRARAVRMSRAAGGRDTAWSRSRTPHQGRSPGDRGWPGCRGRPGHAGWPSRVHLAGRAAGRCVAPPLPRVTRRRRPSWPGTAAPSRLPWLPARPPPGRAGVPAGWRGFRHRRQCQGSQRPARAGSWSRRPTLARTRTATTGRPALVLAS